MIFVPLVEKQYVKHILIQWRAQASGEGGGEIALWGHNHRLGGGGGGGGGKAF